MGVDRWVLRRSPVSAGAELGSAAGPVDAIGLTSSDLGVQAAGQPGHASPEPRPHNPPEAHTPDLLPASESPGAISSKGGPGLTDLDSVASLDWSALQLAVEGCRACGLHENRTQTVFGVGSRQARLMVIGEAPGADEDEMIKAIGFERYEVYIANIVKCRPPGNRDPHIEEAAACRPYLLRQIELIRPVLILSAGRVSAHNLLGTDLSVGRLRGRVHRLEPGDVPLIVTYHPAYLLRRPQEKAKSWQDLQSAWRLLNDAWGRTLLAAADA